MKQIITLVFCMFLINVVYGQQVTFIRNYETLKDGSDPDLSVKFSKTDNIFQVVFSSPAKAKSLLTKLTLTTKGDALDNKSAIYNGKQLSGKRADILEFNMSNKLPVANFKLGFLERGKLIGKLYTMEFQQSTPVVNPLAAPVVTPVASPVGGIGGAITVTHYSPIAPPVPLIFKAPIPKEFNYEPTGKKLYNKSATTELIYVFSGNDYNNFFANGEGDLNLKVGQPLTIILNPVPNPLRYVVKINTSFTSYNDNTDSTTEKLLLNPYSLLGKNLAFAGSIGASKQKALGYLQEVNSKLIQYLNSYQQIDGIDPSKFEKNKQQLKKDIDNYLSTDVTLGYPGNISDFLIDQFDASDSVYIKPFLTTWNAFVNFDVTPLRYQISQLPNRDELNIKLVIRPKTPATTALQIDTSVTMNIPLFGGFKVDISPGIFYSFFHQAKYTFKTDSVAVVSGTTTTYEKFKTIITEKQPNGSVGFSTLMHFYSRWTKDINFALSIGAGLTLDDNPQIRYLTGGSILFGRINRIALSGGYSFGRVSQISNRYTDSKTANTDTSIDTYKVLKGGGFIALSYNIPLLKRSASK